MEPKKKGNPPPPIPLPLWMAGGGGQEHRKVRVAVFLFPVSWAWTSSRSWLACMLVCVCPHVCTLRGWHVHYLFIRPVCRAATLCISACLAIIMPHALFNTHADSDADSYRAICPGYAHLLPCLVLSQAGANNCAEPSSMCACCYLYVRSHNTPAHKGFLCSKCSRLYFLLPCNEHISKSVCLHGLWCALSCTDGGVEVDKQQWRTHNLGVEEEIMSKLPLH